MTEARKHIDNILNILLRGDGKYFIKSKQQALFYVILEVIPMLKNTNYPDNQGFFDNMLISFEEIALDILKVIELDISKNSEDFKKNGLFRLPRKAIDELIKKGETSIFINGKKQIIKTKDVRIKKEDVHKFAKELKKKMATENKNKEANHERN